MQEYSSRKEVLNTVARTVLFLGLAIFVSQLANKRGFDVLNPLYIINITLDIFGMLVGYIILVGLYLDKQKKGKTIKYLMAIIVITYIGLFTDAVEYISDGVPEYRMHNIFVTVLYYITIPANAVLFWHYTMNYLKVRNKKLITINKFVAAGFIVTIIVRILNVKYGYYFTIDEMGIYSRGPYYSLSKVYFVVIMILSLSVIVAERKQFKPIQLIAVFLYALAPILVGVISIWVRGLSLTPITTMVITLFMYCALNVTQGRELAVSEREISIASSIQENVLPKTFPYLPDRKEFDLYAIMKPAKEVGGDFYDFFMVDDNHLALVIADVSGKGIPAALFMMNSRTLIRNRIQAGDSLSKIFYEVNNQLCEGNIADLFITVWVGIIDLNTGEGVEVNAGHLNPVIRRAGESYQLVSYPHDLAVAMLPDMEYHARTFKLNPGDSLFVYTDGVTEAMDANEMLYSKESLEDTLNTALDATPQEAIELVLKSIYDFVKDAGQNDDITMLCLTYNGKQD
ncbi:Serine phosphatase RsbU, regulator of sigma subunit [Pseudobutyrivibrio sp. YE44]|uniref:PP2C family protein-serine/threonine phosphatase n=1 Tax=Pseudobutyrivibrio sp. YE44 TaxID=1520802 RepID=UPI000886EDA9|nr:SpoIIE family protein phosphatase [Pseudobutyrivibrio sp. YE44]SDB50775.1 Serine phosphatase RsbU, regulator of sigma subunit [Pseudobutyrivibrio sp. YE44]